MDSQLAVGSVPFNRPGMSRDASALVVRKVNPRVTTWESRR